jgi:ketosteroid isomerase-like protein
VNTTITKIARELFSAFSERDLDRILELTDPNLAFFAPQTGEAAQQPYHYYGGHDGLREYLTHVTRVWESLEVWPVDFVEKDECVLALGYVYAVPRVGVPARRNVAWAWKVRDGKVVWGRVYTDEEEARRDLGMESVTGG